MSDRDRINRAAQYLFEQVRDRQRFGPMLDELALLSSDEGEPKQLNRTGDAGGSY
jgi:hypothetical protein